MTIIGAGARPEPEAAVIRAAVQHRDQLLRLGLSYVLGGEPDIEVTGCAATAADLVSLCTDHETDAVLVELRLPDLPRLVAALRQRHRTIRVIGIHADGCAAASRGAEDAGVSQRVSYQMGADGVLATLRDRHPASGDHELRDAASTRTRSLLTMRERDVLNLVAVGHRSQDIAMELDISLKTVENHKQRLFRKLGVQNQAHAVSVAIRHGLLTRPVPHG